MGDADLRMIAREQEALGLQKNKVSLSQLSAFQILLDDYYGSSRPSSDDYANRRDLIRIFNEIAKEMYGNDDKCPVVEIFGSFLMDMFNAKSDLDLSINFSDKLFEADRITKIKTLRKFAKKFYALRNEGHVTTVELILSARVPVLKVTDSGSGIECDFSVGNRDGIAKSHIVLLISAIDERLQKLSYMLKAWAKAHDINSSKDGTLNSLSLILLAAFHLQTRDIPILPPFFAIFRDGTDPVAVKKIIPSFLNYGKRNKESLAELFFSLLVKLESVETLWLRGLCASTYEGSWVYKNWKATGCIRIEDFSDRSQNTARAVRAANINKIYSCIRRSVEQIQSFTEGIISADKLKNLLFGKVPPQTKKTVANVNDSELSKPVSQNPTLNKKKRLSWGGSAKGQRPGKQGEHCHYPYGTEVPTPSGIGGVRKMSRKRKKYDAVTSDSLTSNSFQRLDKSQETLARKEQPLHPSPIQSSGGFRPKRARAFHITHFDTLRHAAGQPLVYSDLYFQGSGGFRPNITHDETLRHVALNYPPHQPMSSSDSRGFRPERNRVETMKYAVPKYTHVQPLSHCNLHIQGHDGHKTERTHVTNTPDEGFRRYMPDRVHSETSSYSVPKSRLLPLAAGFRPQRAHAETYHHATSSSQTSLRYTLSNRPSSSALPPHQPFTTAPYSNTAGLQRSHDSRQSFSHVLSHANMRPYQS